VTTQSEALRLAEYMDAPLNNPADVADAAVAELRRLHALNGELLEALKQALEECIWPNERLSDVHAKARAAIAKAEGQA